jgi:hypothetical protein
MLSDALKVRDRLRQHSGFPPHHGAKCRVRVLHLTQRPPQVPAGQESRSAASHPCRSGTPLESRVLGPRRPALHSWRGPRRDHHPVEGTVDHEARPGREASRPRRVGSAAQQVVVLTLCMVDHSFEERPLGGEQFVGESAVALGAALV